MSQSAPRQCVCCGGVALWPVNLALTNPRCDRCRMRCLYNKGGYHHKPTATKEEVHG